MDILVWAYTVACLAVAARLGWIANDAADFISLGALLGMVTYVQWNYWREG